MLHPVTVRTLALAACGWLPLCEAMALTLGEPRGTILIGRPLELSLPLTLDAADGEGACPSGELFYGDARVGAAPGLRWNPGPDGRQGVLRISSPVPVDEPLVTLSLRVGCGASVTTRRYTLLSEVPSPSEPSVPLVARAPAPRAAAAPAATAPPPAPAPAARQRRQAAAPAAAAAARSSASGPRTARPARGDSRRQARAQTQPAAPQPATRPRLRLEPLEPGPERDPVLHLSTELAPPPAADPQARAAAAALWRALNRTPEETLREAARLQALERDMQSLRQQTQQNAAAVSAMRGEVLKARGARNHVSMLAVVLFALLLAVGAWLMWRWHQSRRLDGVARWFEAHGQADAGQAGAGAAGAGAAFPASPPAEPVHPHLATAPLDLAAARAAVADWKPPEAAGEFQLSLGGSLRTVGVRELLDVHDKADFFLSIGQQDQAIAVLENHVHDQVETSALPWLDLLELYHSLGRRAEFEQRRAQFRQRFTAQVPDFDHFGEPTASLEDYGRALSRIVALWPSRRVLEVIEESIFRKPGLAGAEAFSLQAYRELVLLYHIAQEVAPAEGGAGDIVDLDRQDTEFRPTALQSLGELDSQDVDLEIPLDLDDLPAPARPAQALALVPDSGHAPVAVSSSLPPTSESTVPWGDPYAADPLMIPPASPRLGLDIDLSDAGAVARASRELPPLDFDTSEFEAKPTEDPAARRE